MPLNPFLKQPKPMGPPINPEQQDAQANMIQGFDPSWKQNLRAGFDGITDTTLGALGVGNDTPANRFGAMIPAAMGLGGATMRGMSALRGAPRSIPPMAAPNGNNIMPNQLPKMNAIPMESLYDSEGRFLGAQKGVDPAYAAHVASSRNKYRMK